MIRNATKRVVSNNLSGSRNLTNRSLSIYSVAMQKHGEAVIPFSMKDTFRYSPNEGYVRLSPFNEIAMQNLTIDQYIWQDSNFENNIAIKCGETGRQYTYIQLRHHTAALAVRLQTQFGLKHRDIIAICLPNIPEFAIATLAVFEAGFILTLVNPLYTADEICKQLLNSGAKIIISIPEIHSTLQNAVAKTKKPIKIISIKTSESQSLPADAINFYELIRTQDVNFGDLKKYDISPSDVAFLPSSSGTSGTPKGVMLSHDNIVTNCEQFNVPLPNTPLINKTTASYQEVCPAILPFFHIFGFTVCLISKLRLRTKIISLPRFNPETFMDSIVVEKASVVHLVPPIVLFLGSHAKVTPKHLENVKAVVSGAAPIGNLDAERFVQKAPHCDFIQGYGLTETSPGMLMNVKGTKLYASVGGPMPLTEVKIIDINDPLLKGLGPNEKGEVLARGPQNMIGYLNNSEATNNTILPDKWLRTGDMGYYDEDGYFYVTDRLKELIKVKGFQVPPAELEEILRDHPKVADAAVIAAPHKKHGEVPHAFVVKKEGADVTDKELQDYVAQKVAPYKHLEIVTFLKQIPKKPTGKILRRQLKEEFYSEKR